MKKNDFSKETENTLGQSVKQSIQQAPDQGKQTSVQLDIPSPTDGLSRKILPKNPWESDGTVKNLLTQEMVIVPYTVYYIQDAFDLNGQTITIPDNCILHFDGGSLSNGMIKGNYFIGNEYITPIYFGWGNYPVQGVFELMASVADSSGCGISVPNITVNLTRPVITKARNVKDSGTYPNYRLIYSGEDLLPKVSPKMTPYGYYRYSETNGYHAHQSLAYDPTNKRLLFGVKNSYQILSKAYVYVTDMNLELQVQLELEGAYHINDMVISNDLSQLIVAPLDNQQGSILNVYNYPVIKTPFIYPLRLQSTKNLSSDFNNHSIDAICISREEKMYIVKGGNTLVFYDYNFKKINSVKIDQKDMHGDDIWSQTIEYYNGYILQMNTGNYTIPEMDYSSKNAYLNVYRIDGSRIDTYRYPDSVRNMEAEGICHIGNGKYLFTHYGGPEIEIRMLDFNLPTHSHSYTDLIDLHKLGTTSKNLYVNPNIAGKSCLTPDGTAQKPFPTIYAAIDYAKVFLSHAIIILMEGKYGDLNLNNIYMDLTFRGNYKNDVSKCQINKVSINKCRDLLFENIMFTGNNEPVNAYSTNLEISNCIIPNGSRSETYSGIYIGRNSMVTLRGCTVNGFQYAVNIYGSILFLEGALEGSNNIIGIRGTKSVIMGAKEISIGASNRKLSATCCVVENSDNYLNLQIAKQTDPSAIANSEYRPQNPLVGNSFFDTQINKPLWWNGTDWGDAAGNIY